MRGHAKLIVALQEALGEELTAVNPYFVMRNVRNYHYATLGTFIKKQSSDEIKHVEQLVARQARHLTIGCLHLSAKALVCNAGKRADSKLL